MPYCPYHRAARMLAHAPSPDRLPQNNTMVSSWRNDDIQVRHAPQFSRPAKHSLDRATA